MSGVDYDTASGTSFSAPMIAGVIALGYNKYGYVSPDTIRTSLNESLKMNDAGNYLVDASSYLDILDKKSDIIKKEQKEQIDFQKNEKNTNSGAKKGSSSNIALKKTLSSSDTVSDADFLSQAGLIDSSSFAT